MTKFFSTLLAYIKQARCELLVVVIVAAVDLLSKNIVQSSMYLGQEITVIPGLLYFKYLLNDKAAYGNAFGLEKIFGEDGVITFFIVLTVIALIVFGYVMWRFRNRNLLVRVSLGLIMGGAFGNLVDRMVLRMVRDFICISVFGIEPFGSFNVADMALVFGVILFAAYFIFLFDKDEKRLTDKNCGSADTSEISGKSDIQETTADTVDAPTEQVDVELPTENQDGTVVDEKNYTRVIPDVKNDSDD